MLIIQFKITSNRRHKYAERSFIITCNIQISMNHSIINPQEIERSKGKVSVPLLKKLHAGLAQNSQLLSITLFHAAIQSNKHVERNEEKHESHIVSFSSLSMSVVRKSLSPIV